MKIQKFGIESYYIFDTRRDGDRMMVHFIWGKKDFRIYLQPADTGASGDPHAELPPVQTSAGETLQVTGLQYLNNYEWYDYAGVAGHGLAHDEVRWTRGKRRRYVELPKDFVDHAVGIACREFGLEQKAS